MSVAHKLGQSHILVTADMAIYSKTQEILWNKPESLAGKVTMRLGGMHHLMAFIASIGKLFGDGGLMQLLTVTGVYANDTARLMLQGKQIVRAVRGIKLVLEALSHLYITSAEAWAKSEGVVWQDRDIKNDIDDLQRTFRAKDMQLCSLMSRTQRDFVTSRSRNVNTRHSPVPTQLCVVQYLAIAHNSKAHSLCFVV